jgi:hypothetical protein
VTFSIDVGSARFKPIGIGDRTGEAPLTSILDPEFIKAKATWI